MHSPRRLAVALVVVAFSSGIAYHIGVNAQAQNPTSTSSGTPTSTAGLNPCILGCVTNALPAGGCSITDLQCMCTNTAFQSAAASCLASSCTAPEQAAATSLQASECAAITGSGSSSVSTPSSSSVSTPTSSSSGSSGSSSSGSHSSSGSSTGSGSKSTSTSPSTSGSSSGSSTVSSTGSGGTTHSSSTAGRSVVLVGPAHALGGVVGVVGALVGGLLVL